LPVLVRARAAVHSSEDREPDAALHESLDLDGLNIVAFVDSNAGHHGQPIRPPFAAAGIPGRGRRVTMSRTPTRCLLREGRGLQRYTYGQGAPPFALRRYVRLLGRQSDPLHLPSLWWRLPWLTACLEPLPLMPRSAASKELDRRLFLVALITELTPWGAAENAAGAARSLPAEIVRSLGFSLIELLALPLRIAAYGLTWLPQRRRT
jgi:hypothetical protein